MNKTLICSISIINIDHIQFCNEEKINHNNHNNKNDNSNNIRNNNKNDDCKYSTNSFKFSIFLALGCLDGRLKMVEISNKGNIGMITKENGNLDLQRDTRYLNGNSETDQTSPVYKSSINSFSEGLNSKDEKTIRKNQNDIIPTVRKESSFVPISIKYINVFECSILNDRNISDKRSVSNNMKGGAGALKDDKGFIMVSTASALLLISIMVRTIVHTQENLLSNSFFVCIFLCSILAVFLSFFLCFFFLLFISFYLFQFSSLFLFYFLRFFVSFLSLSMLLHLFLHIFIFYFFVFCCCFFSFFIYKFIYILIYFACLLIFLFFHFDLFLTFSSHFVDSKIYIFLSQHLIVLAAFSNFEIHTAVLFICEYDICCLYMLL